MSIDPRQSVGQIVAERLPRAGVFEAIGIDYCCHGETPLNVACDQRGQNVDDVLARLMASDEQPPESDAPDYLAMPLGQLADHIESTHHVLMRTELPRLRQLLAKVREAHGGRHPELIELGEVLAGLQEEIDAHLLKEERVLFPIVKQLEAATALPSFHCGSVANPIRVMEHEHETVGTALARMKSLTDGFATPADGCSSYRLLMGGLAALEADLHRHIHKENNILFPRAAALEAELASRRG